MVSRYLCFEFSSGYDELKSLRQRYTYWRKELKKTRYGTKDHQDIKDKLAVVSGRIMELEGW
jgi:hypothetical protein